MGQVLMVISTTVSALAALSIAVLTFFLVRATNRYAGETTTYVRLVQEQLNLLRAQLAAPLLLDVGPLQVMPQEVFVRCRHSGNASSFPAIITAIRLELRLFDSGEEAEFTDEQPLNNEVLKPGGTWRKWVRGLTVSKVVTLPAPGFLGLIRGAKERSVGRLTASLRFQRAGQTEQEEITREYWVRMTLFGPPKLDPL